ncbi:POK1, partial [Enterospora canceri]
MLNKKSQSDVFEIFKECISTNVESGYNCTVFAYGQTGSGKTYTIQGEMNNEGLVLRTLRFLHTKYKNLKISFLEIYNEELVDLSQMDSTQLNLREDKSGCVLVDGINLLDSASFAESESFYLNGIVNRKTSSTSCNEKSSRSHSIFTVYLEQEIDLISDKVRIKTSKLTFVDLAGSERLKEVENEKANSTKIFKETTTINKSLMNLGIVVNCLEQRAARHVPYRDSKLTFLLKDSLGGNSKLCIIGNISLCNQPDTTNTLQFLERIKLITNNPTVNY